MDERLSRIAARYASCASYVDEGTSIVRIRDGEMTLEMRLRFGTWFARDPLRFRFVAEETVGDTYATALVVHAADGDIRQLSSSSTKLRRHTSLGRAIDAATAESQGLVRSIGGLLLPSVVREASCLRGVLRAVGESSVEGIACTRYELEHRSHEIHVYVDDSDFIRRIDDRWLNDALLAGPLATEQTTILRGAFNVTIREESLQLDASLPQPRRMVN